MKQKLNDLLEQTIIQIQNTGNLEELENIRINVLGRKGQLTEILKSIGSLSAEERPQIGALANLVKQKITETIENKYGLQDSNLGEQKDFFDITEPGTKPNVGTLHPISQVINEVKNIFSSLGFVYEVGPEIEWDYYNFEALNMPKHHPARDTQDTFYLTDDMLLRTQTSPVQIRVMERQKPPIRMFSIGKCYRRDYDITHTPMFHQFEGLVVDKNITMSDLKGILTFAMKALFGENTKVRFRPHHFPFTEPSIEPDVTCSICKGEGCRTCKHTGWLEMGGAGMVSPHVLRNVGYNPDEVSGFAFGFGIERPVMIKYQIDDIRLLFENDIRFLRQF